MICYRDTTFCPYYLDCKHGDGCSAALTLEVERRAKDVGLPICEHAEPPRCYTEVEHETA